MESDEAMIRLAKTLIAKTTAEQDRIFEDLCIVLEITENNDGEKDWMFDYIFNDNSDDTYEEYLKRFRQ